MSLRLPMVGAPLPKPDASHAARGARMRVERRVLTICARDGSAELFARTLVDALVAHGQPSVLLGRRAGQGARATDERLAEALAVRGALVVVSDRALAIEIEGLLDVWVGARPLPGGDAFELAAYGGCQLELRATPEPVARLLAAELAPLLAARRT